MMYAILGIIYAIVLVPIVYLLIRTLRKLSVHKRRAEIFEGIATSCFVAVCAALLLTSGVGVRGGLLVWAAYAAVTGISIWLPAPPKLFDALAAAAAPSLVLLGSLLAIYLLPLAIGQVAGAVVSASSPTSAIDTWQALALTLFASAVSVVGTAIGIYARSLLVRVTKSAMGLQPAAFENVEKILNTCVRIGVIVLTIFAVTRT